MTIRGYQLTPTQITSTDDQPILMMTLIAPSIEQALVRAAETDPAHAPWREASENEVAEHNAWWGAYNDAEEQGATFEGAGRLAADAMRASRTSVPSVTNVTAEEEQPRSVHVPALEAGMTLVGGAGGHSKITGEVYSSNTLPGMHVVETEHGTLYLETDAWVKALAR